MHRAQYKAQPSVRQAGAGCIAALLAALASGCAAPTLKPRSASCTMAVLIAPIVGCASTPLASQELDDDAKRFAPEPGTSQIYIVRPSLVGSRFPWWVQIDGEPAGVLSVDTYVMQPALPGPHHVTIITSESRHTLELTPDDGASLFLEAVPQMGRTEARAQLRVLQPEQGRRRVLDARRVATPSQRVDPRS